MYADFRLIAIPPPAASVAEFADNCRRVEAGGATALQVRRKDVSAVELLRTVEQALTAVRIPVYVNDRADVAVAAGAAGVHLGAEDLPPTAIRIVVPRPFRVGVSVGRVDEARHATRADADYWSIGPFYATGTKTDAGFPLGASGFRRLANRVPEGIPVVAIGGIDATNVAEVVTAGAAGVAVVSSIFSSGHVESVTRAIRDALDSALGA